jgi:anti-sigma factor RsiW
MSAEGRPYITCHELLDFLHLYLEDELPEGRRTEFDRHLAVCDPCRAYIRQYEEAIKLGKAAFAPDLADALPGDTPEELVQAILKTRRRTGA